MAKTVPLLADFQPLQRPHSIEDPTVTCIFRESARVRRKAGADKWVNSGGVAGATIEPGLGRLRCRYGLQPPSLWRVPTAAISDEEWLCRYGKVALSVCAVVQTMHFVRRHSLDHQIPHDPQNMPPHNGSRQV